MKNQSYNKNSKLNLGRNVFLLETFTEINKLCRKNNIDIIPLKGIAYLQTIYKGSIAEREISDIDILVRVEDVPEVSDLLKSIGYACDNYSFKPEQPYSIYLNSMVFRRKSAFPYFIHLHWHILNTSLPLFMFRINVQEIFSESQHCLIDGIDTTMMSKEDSFLHAALHAFLHSYDRESLKVDLIQLDSYYFKDFDIQKLIDRAERWNLKAPLYCALRFLNKDINIDLTTKEKQEVEKFIAYVDENEIGFQNQVMPIYLAMCKSSKERLSFLVQSQFPPVDIIKKIYNKSGTLQVWSLYFKRLCSSFMQFKNLFGFAHKKQLALSFFKYLTKFRKTLFGMLLAISFGTVAAVASPYFSKSIVDSFIAKDNWWNILTPALIASTLFIIGGFLQSIALYLRKSLRLKVMSDIAIDIFDAIESMPLNLNRKECGGEKIYSVHNDSERIADCLTSSLADAVQLFPKFICILLIVFLMDAVTALFAFVLLPVLYFVFMLLTSRMKAGLKIILKQEGKIFSYLDEFFARLYIVKALDTHEYEKGRYNSLLDEYVEKQQLNLKYEVAGSFVSSGFNRIALGLIILFSGWRISIGSLSAGTFTAIMIYLSQLFLLSSASAHFFQRLSLGLVSCDRVQKILSTRRGRINATLLGSGFETSLNNGIKISNLSFSYNKQKKIFENVSVDFEPGFNALVGPSGCGKTTLINIILGLCGDEDRVALMRPLRVGIVLQEPYLWNDTVANNIVYGSKGIDVEHMLEAARLAGVDEFVKTLADGYQTVIGSNADFVSEGQKQKIALARALVSKPEILILDEAFASIDSNSEQQIIENLKELSWLKTVIMVSHRISAIKQCDRVYYLKDKETIITGKTEKMLNNTEITELFNGQT